MVQNDHSVKLTIIKLIHTAIWVFFNIVIFYVLYAAISGNIDTGVWVCTGIVLLEAVVLLIFKMKCPLTVIARRYSSSTRNNFDIFLPNWLAKYNKLIYTIIFVVSLIILLYRVAA
jgi:hypothetical protein